MAMKKLKRHVILLELIRGHSLNRSDAARLGDTCLNTTIADLQRRLGFYIDRQREKCPCRTGFCWVNRYSIAKADRQKAAEILADELVSLGTFKSKAAALQSIGSIN